MFGNEMQFPFFKVHVRYGTGKGQGLVFDRGHYWDGALFSLSFKNNVNNGSDENKVVGPLKLFGIQEQVHGRSVKRFSGFMEVVHIDGFASVQIGQKSCCVLAVILFEYKVVGESFWEAGQYNFPIAKGLLYDIRMFCQGSRAIRTGINLTENGCPMVNLTFLFLNAGLTNSK